MNKIEVIKVHFGVVANRFGVSVHVLSAPVVAFSRIGFIQFNLISVLRREIVRDRGAPEIYGNHIKGDKPFRGKVSSVDEKRREIGFDRIGLLPKGICRPIER